MIPSNILEQYLVKSGIVSTFRDNIDYIQEYGDISLYENEEEFQTKIIQIEEYMEKVNTLLEEICVIVKDNYEV